MFNNRIKYIVFYPEDNKENRQGALSAKTKIDYISQALEESFKVEIVSASWTNNSYGIYKSKKTNLSNNILLRQFFTFGVKSKIGRYLKCFISLFQICLYLLIFTKKKESIIVYHSVILYYPIKLIKKIKKISVILEVEEVYQDIQSMSKYMKRMEQQLFDIADKYIFSTELLSERLNQENKPYVVIYGTYKVEKQIAKKNLDGKIHLVYAGTLDPKKGGAQLAVNSGKYLNENFHIHILGFGSDSEKDEINKLIQKILKDTSCKITYDGVLSGRDYTKFIQECHIGLSTQISTGKYNDTSFPSKILSYLSNGLQVLSIRIKVLEISKINKLLHFYNQSNPRDIAKKILEIEFSNKYNSRLDIKKLDKEFKEKIEILLKI